MNQFLYKKHNNIKALSASITDFSYKKHSHGEYAIGVTKRGIQHYHLDGNLQLSHKNGIMFFNPEQLHDGAAHNEQGLDYIMLYLEPRLLLEAMEQKDYIYFSTPVIYNHNIQQHVMNLATAVLTEADECICDDLLFNLAENLTINTNRIHNQDTLIKKMKEDIQYNIKRLSVESISEKFSMSKFQFIRFFKSQTGITPYQFYLNKKVDNARKFIEKEEDAYLAVSEFDFVDLTHLNRQFKRVYGLTAIEYLKQIK
ncbi:AraC family transcriptional regulator [Sporosarcina cascadiensis]|uniref:AraC family transcriptional regulator n=1 Tax=Sporosarcina cascadiensis TaxID=2660747 RepID=UPI00129A163B|nr:AraC family transcriptional regulator [Sporosarcina cascadiensis]